LTKARTVMVQPGDSAPHDDHIHVRIACEQSDYENGCDGGPYWPWVPRPPPPHPANLADSQLLEDLLAPLMQAHKPLMANASSPNMPPNSPDFSEPASVDAN
jgi:penicillin-insensitive murein endopeptidase